LTDSSSESKEAISLLESKNIEFVIYDIRKFEESCCGELPTTRAPSVFAPEGIFKGLNGIMNYISMEKMNNSLTKESDSAYW
jgi:hypothetical protein